MVEIIMAFDFGTKNIGIAIGQNLTYTTRPLTVIKSQLGSPHWNAIEFIYNEWSPVLLIVGLPLNIDGSEQPITFLSKKFAIQLKKRFQTTVKMHDERFSTIEARSIYLKYYRNRLTTSKQHYQINAIAAAVILTSWLNQHKHMN